MNSNDLIPHLFRTEYSKIVSVICRHFGLNEIEIAEDIASDTFLAAAQSWSLHGLPENPTAWLYSVAKNKTRNQLKREKLFAGKILSELKNNAAAEGTDIDLSNENINDSLLEMMFAVCNPAIPVEAQIGLSLRILCGFGIEEIASAFLTNKETINKRLFRAKEILREQPDSLSIPGSVEINERLDAVLRTIYLFFSEGYYSSGKNRVIRKDLCVEAIRLCTILSENENTRKPEVYALLSLMCFHASRLDARMDNEGQMILYDEQDDSLWNRELICKGAEFLNLASTGSKLSKYHIEAAIAFWHTQKNDTTEKWENILQHYNLLLQIEYSPAAALNRIFALSKTRGKQAAIQEAEKLKLENDHFYYFLLGELYTGIDNARAKFNFEKAFSLTKNPSDKRTIRGKIENL